MECEICGDDVAGSVRMDPKPEDVKLCATCLGGVQGHDVPQGHWMSLTTAMWSDRAAVQVLCWRMLNRFRDQGWAADALDMLFLKDDVVEWAKAGGSDVIHRDSNGDVLTAGDTVVLIKDLPVKGAGFTAKRGTAVRGISLVQDNPGQIEGRVEGQRIVILTEFVKRK